MRRAVGASGAYHARVGMRGGGEEGMVTCGHEPSLGTRLGVHTCL